LGDADGIRFTERCPALLLKGFQPSLILQEEPVSIDMFSLRENSLSFEKSMPIKIFFLSLWVKLNI
jgi:hypothetical protein